jgi:hypothetical protein
MKADSLIGARFDRWLVIGGPIKSGGFRTLKWICRCDCGKEKYVRANHLLSYRSRSCGCFRKEEIKRLLTTHGMTHTRAYRKWAGMHTRCYNKNEPTWDDYGGRGITVCDSWHKFENFYADMGNPPKGMSLERINNNAGYSKDNCRWATQNEQAKNTRRNIFLTICGICMCVADWARFSGGKYETIKMRHKRGWRDDEAVYGRAF